MTKVLATVKKAYQITMSNWDKETVLLETAPDWQEIISKKWVARLDNITFNGSYIATVKEVNLADQWVDSAKAYANALKWEWKVIACERVRSYEAQPNNGQMPLQKLKDRLEMFREKWKTDQYCAKYYELFVWAGGNEGDIR